MDPILTIMFSAILSGIIAWLIAEKRIRSEPDLHRNRILVEMKVDIIKSIQSLLDCFTFNDKNDIEFQTWIRRLANINLTVIELMNDESSIFTTNATVYCIMYKDGKIDKREFSAKTVGALANANACIKVSTGFIDGPAPVPDEYL